MARWYIFCLFLIILALVLILLMYRCSQKEPKQKKSPSPIAILVFSAFAITAILWLALGIPLMFVNLVSAIQYPERIDWSSTGSMLTALVAVPGTIAAVYFGIIQYRREEQEREKQKQQATPEGASAIGKIKDELPADVPGTIQPKP